MDSIIFDYLTIFPPSKEKYVSPWVINNCTKLMDKFIIKEVYCRNVHSTPRIHDSNYRAIIVPFLENGIFPSSLPHLSSDELVIPKISFFQKIRQRYFYSKQEKENELMNFNDKYLRSYYLNFKKDVALTPLIPEWNTSPHAINYLSCDYEIIPPLESDISVNTEGVILKLGTFKNETKKLMDYFSDNQKPDKKTLNRIAFRKMSMYSPELLGEFLTYHLEGCPYSIYSFLEMVTSFADVMYFESESTQSINYQLVFKDWLLNTIKSKKLDIQKLGDSVREKINDVNRETTIKPPTTPELIKLNYGVNNDKVIQLLYNELNGKLIENIDFRDFERHFKDNGAELKKIQWKGTHPEIIRLFTGLPMSATSASCDLYGIKIDSNHEGYYEIIRHFYYLNRSKTEAVFIYETLTSKKSGETRQGNTKRIHTILENIRNVVS